MRIRYILLILGFSGLLAGISLPSYAQTAKAETPPEEVIGRPERVVVVRDFGVGGIPIVLITVGSSAVLLYSEVFGRKGKAEKRKAAESNDF